MAAEKSPRELLREKSLESPKLRGTGPGCLRSSGVERGVSPAVPIRVHPLSTWPNG